MTEDLLHRAENIQLLALDSDGVLTDGGVYMSEDGSEFRRFNIKDGLGIKRVLSAGIKVAIISAAGTQAVMHRAQKLGITDAYINVHDKLETLQSLCQRYQISLEQVAYMGDDLNDLPVLRCVGLPCAPADAVESVKAAARMVTRHAGGQGAVRDVCDVLVPLKEGQ